jgi:light-regulated signal transduction histidine kinase (bacteriophytochrome)
LSHPFLPIILATSVGDEMLVAEALRSGVSDYIPKGRIDVESLRRIVAGAILACSQKQLIEAQRGELEYFAFALAHDFKQPIRQIITFSQLVSEALTADASDDIRTHLGFLGDAAERLDRLVDVMGQYTLLNHPPELGDIDLQRVITAVRASLAPYLEERGGEFLSPDHVPALRGNETLMIQVLENLVINGLKYNRSPAPRVELTILQDHTALAIVVRDNGIGIEPGYIAEIFKPLVRLHTSAQYAGSGLGLTLARKAVMAQAGDIWCDSVPGEGSAFHIRLPAAADNLKGVPL